ncbi:hypothetical protein GCM10025883_42450 [Mobilicoccus caccae]|uniref:PTS EIIA type-1 domain-containing protein n=2 Tax=Mobilicoccus caccae TaxID=1859295 RepID=A0ABQ6IW83_9MICO|nr:hypothetical protein GCM10025883_42450 [Mobilicoccus caccae]
MEVGNNVQAVFGPQADALKGDMKRALAGEDIPTSSAPGTTATATATKASTSGVTTVLAPISGRVLPLSEVPDETFAKGMVGHGLAIDPPRSVVEAVAPVDGTVVQLWPHAYAIQTDDGVGVLVHLGLDTVQLRGQGFTTQVEQGARVRTGDLVIRYDVPTVAGTGRNPIVPVVVLEAKADGIRGDAHREVERLDELFTSHR